MTDRRREQARLPRRPRRSCTAAVTSRTRRSSSCGPRRSRSSAAEPLPLEVDGEPIGTTPARFEIVPARAAATGAGCVASPLAAAAAFAALAGLVASGALTSLDQWAVDHAMPFAAGSSGPPTLLESVVPLLHAQFHPLGAGIAQIVTLPGQVVISLLLVVAAAWKLAEGHLDRGVGGRGGRRARLSATRLPGRRSTGTESISSRSTRRGPAATRFAARSSPPRSRPPGRASASCSALWLVAVVVLLELAGFHTPTDIAGGLLLATTTAAEPSRSNGQVFFGVERLASGPDSWKELTPSSRVRSAGARAPRTRASAAAARRLCRREP